VPAARPATAGGPVPPQGQPVPPLLQEAEAEPQSTSASGPGPERDGRPVLPHSCAQATVAEAAAPREEAGAGGAAGPSPMPGAPPATSSPPQGDQPPTTPMPAATTAAQSVGPGASMPRAPTAAALSPALEWPFLSRLPAEYPNAERAVLCALGSACDLLAGLPEGLGLGGQGAPRGPAGSAPSAQRRPPHPGVLWEIMRTAVAVFFLRLGRSRAAPAGAAAGVVPAPVREAGVGAAAKSPEACSVMALPSLVKRMQQVSGTITGWDWPLPLPQPAGPPEEDPSGAGHNAEREAEAESRVQLLGEACAGAVAATASDAACVWDDSALWLPPPDMPALPVGSNWVAAALEIHSLVVATYGHPVLPASEEGAPVRMQRLRPLIPPGVMTRRFLIALLMLGLHRPH
jgi:hypothetical protein